jgi:FADH2 O2-dependent halogenase
MIGGAVETKRPKPAHSADIVILGSGLAGTVLASVLARNGADVLVIDAGSHPRFAIGESTIPYTSMLMRLVAERYNVPEIKWLATFEAVQSKISTNSGVKRNFGFLYHRKGEKHDVTEANELPIPKITNTENHFFRQEVDAWMVTVALKYGARLVANKKISNFAFDDDGVDVIAEDGDVIRAKFVVDASGFRSPLAQQFDLREQPSRLRHHSRSLFTHMVDVTPYDDLVRPRGVHGNHQRWNEGTLHHLFEGGWIWVIPFNNHARATNSLVSVGLSLDPRIHPPVEGLTPEQEFRKFIADYPDIEKQFTHARSVREWVSTGRLQYSSKQTVGYRWCLTSHAAGFIDALFSRGLSNTFEIVNALGWRLLDALRDDDFAVERFEFVQTLEQGLLDFNDDLVANAYASFQDYDLWNAWFRVWSISQRLAIFEINRAYARFLGDKDVESVKRLERLAVNGVCPEYPPAVAMFAQANQELRDVAEGRKDSKVAAANVMSLLRNADFIPPALGLGDPDNRCIHVTGPKVLEMLRWAKKDAPPEIGELAFEGITLFLKKRLSLKEFALLDEIKHTLAPLPVIGRPLRVPAPR